MGGSKVACILRPYSSLFFLDTFPRPWLSAEPSSVVTMGQNVTLWCQGPVRGVGYILHKEGKATSMQLWGSTSNEGAFPITNISGASIGRYSCCYHPDWISSIKIQPSNTLELIVTGKGIRLWTGYCSVERIRLTGSWETRRGRGGMDSKMASLLPADNYL